MNNKEKELDKSLRIALKVLDRICYLTHKDYKEEHLKKAACHMNSAMLEIVRSSNVHITFITPAYRALLEDIERTFLKNLKSSDHQQ